MRSRSLTVNGSRFGIDQTRSYKSIMTEPDDDSTVFAHYPSFIKSPLLVRQHLLLANGVLMWLSKDPPKSACAEMT